MPLMKTSNPALGEKTFQDLSRSQYGGYQGDITTRMTLNGTVNKTGILLVCAIATAGWTWLQFMQSRDLADVYPWMLTGMIGGLIFALITIFKKEWSAVTAPVYALLEGLVLGSLFEVEEALIPGRDLDALEAQSRGPPGYIFQFVEGFLVSGKLGQEDRRPLNSFHRRHSLISWKLIFAGRPILRGCWSRLAQRRPCCARPRGCQAPARSVGPTDR